MSSQSWSARINRINFLPALLILGSLGVSLVMINRGQLNLAAFLVLGCWGLAFSWRWPLPLILVVILLSTNLFQFVAPEKLPYLQVAANIRFIAQDIAILMLLGLGIARLVQRGESPLFIRPLFFLVIVIALSSLFGLLAGTTGPKTILNGMRLYSGYLFYIGLVGVIRTKKQTWMLIGLLFAILLVSVGIQFIEAARGGQIVSNLASGGYFSGTSFIDVGGTQVPYLWNRATSYLLIGLVLATAAAFGGKSILLHSFLAIVGLLGFLIASVRSWFVVILCGFIILFILSSQRNTKRLIILPLLALLLLVGVAILDNLINAFPLVDTTLARLGTLTHFQNETNFIVRIARQNQMLDLFWRSPIFGYGVGSGLIDSDLGFVNTLVQIGVMGTLSIAALIIAVAIQSLRTFQSVPDSLSKAYLGGLIAVWGGMLVGYAFNLDFFGFLSMPVGLGMALIDRFCAQSAMTNSFPTPQVDVT